MKEQRASFYYKSSELFENEVYLEEVSDVLCIVQAGTKWFSFLHNQLGCVQKMVAIVKYLLDLAELPNLLPITEVCEALLHLPNGTLLMNRLVANVSDAFHEGVLLCNSLNFLVPKLCCEQLS